MLTLTGAEIMVKLLERQGVRTIAGIPGGSNLPLYDALSQSTRIRHVLTRHEQGAGFIAQGMARVTGRPGVCMTTSGPGATNIVTALADAMLDSVPLVCITGQVPSAMIGTDAFQEVDTYGMTIPVTKHNFLVRSVEELMEVIPEAFRIAGSGRKGPVLVDVPKDVQTNTMSFKYWPGPVLPEPAPDLDRTLLHQAAEMINRAERPVLYLGGGVIGADASMAARLLAEKGGIPATMTLLGLGAMPSDHSLCLGMLGMHAARYTNLVLEDCDLLIAAGVRFDDRATGKVAEFCPEAEVIHIDIDPSELGKIRKAHLGMTGDVEEALTALLPLVEEKPRLEWLTRVAELKRDYPMEIPEADDPCSAYGLILASAEILGRDAIVATDVGQHQMRTAQAYPFSRPRRWLTSGGLGTMGFGMPAAIGAALAKPDATVLCVTGDGSLRMNIQELETAVELGVNVKILLMNNRSLGLVHQQQALFYGNRIFASDYAYTPDFTAIARAFGMPAVDLGTSKDPAKTLAQALRSNGPCLIHAPVEVTDNVYPMVPPGAANKHMMTGEKANACA